MFSEAKHSLPRNVLRDTHPPMGFVTQSNLLQWTQKNIYTLYAKIHPLWRANEGYLQLDMRMWCRSRSKLFLHRYESFDTQYLEVLCTLPQYGL